MKTDVILYFAPIVLAAATFVWWTFSVRRRSRSPLDKYLTPEIEAAGLRFVSSHVCPPGETGPFPTAGGTASHPGAAAFVSTNWQFRRVLVEGVKGKKREVWARLMFGGPIPDIDWQPSLEEIAEQHGGQMSSESARGAHPNETSP